MSGDLALTVRCDDGNDDVGSGSDWDTGPAIGVDAGGGANSEGERDADVDKAGEAGMIWYCDAVVVGMGAEMGDLDFWGQGEEKTNITWGVGDERTK